MTILGKLSDYESKSRTQCFSDSIIIADFWTQKKRNAKLESCEHSKTDPMLKSSNSRRQVQEAIKKIPFGVSKSFLISAEWVLACCYWKCLLIDTGHEDWRAVLTGLLPKDQSVPQMLWYGNLYKSTDIWSFHKSKLTLIIYPIPGEVKIQKCISKIQKYFNRNSDLWKILL